MTAPLKILPEAKEPIDRRNGGTTWDADLGFHLYCVGLNFAEIGHKFGISGRTVCHRADVDGWDAKREIVVLERAKRVGMAGSKEQEFVRSQECDLARKLLGLGHQMLRDMDKHWQSSKTPVADLCKVLDLASRLGRLGSGLPLMPVEIHGFFDLTENLEKSLQRAYGVKEEVNEPIDVSPAQELPPPIEEITA
jgi:hypothetical protein